MKSYAKKDNVVKEISLGCMERMAAKSTFVKCLKNRTQQWTFLYGLMEEFKQLDT